MDLYVPKQETVLGEGQIDMDSLPQLSAYSGDYDQGSVHRQPILDFGDEGFLLSNMFSPAECEYYISEAEKMGMGPIYEANPTYRSSDRVMVKSEELADILFKRVRPFLTDVEIDGDPKEKHVQGMRFLLQGRWTPSGLNPAFRICRYYPGGHFAPHFDGHFVKNWNERSMVTLMLYLNGGFDGGSTNFVDASQKLYTDEFGRYVAEDKNVIYRVKPEEGLAIVFNHHRLHEGGPLLSGVKYILRTDIMYKRTEGLSISANDEKALLLLQEAERLEAAHEEGKAAEMYRRAFKLSPLVEEYHNNG